MDESTLTIREFAALLRVSTRTIRRWLKARRCPVAPLATGRAIRFARADVDRFLKQ